MRAQRNFASRSVSWKKNCKAHFFSRFQQTFFGIPAKKMAGLSKLHSRYPDNCFEWKTSFLRTKKIKCTFEKWAKVHRNVGKSSSDGFRNCNNGFQRKTLKAKKFSGKQIVVRKFFQIMNEKLRDFLSKNFMRVVKRSFFVCGDCSELKLVLRKNLGFCKGSFRSGAKIWPVCLICVLCVETKFCRKSFLL